MNTDRKTIKIQTILKHKIVKPLNESYKDRSSEIQTLFNSTINSTNKTSFDRNYTQLVNILAESVGNVLYPLLALREAKGFKIENPTQYMQEYTSNLVPKLDTDSLSYIENHIDEFDLDDKNLNTLKTAVKENLVADRIINNHENFSERFNIEDTILKSYKLGVNTVAEQVKNMIDTYKGLKPYQRMNLCMEEVFYVLEKNVIDYNKSDIVTAIVEYFLMSEDSDINLYIKTLKENYCFNEADVAPAMEILDDKDKIHCIDNIISEFLRVKTIPIYDLCVNIGGCTINDIKLNIDKVIEFIWRYANSNKDIQYSDIDNAIADMFATIANKINQSDNIVTLEDIRDISILIDKFFDDAEYKSRNDLYTNDKERFLAFAQMVKLHRDQFLKDCAYLYNRNNIDNMIYVNQEASRVMSLQEFKKFRFSNLIKAAINLEKYVKEKASTFIAKHKHEKPVKFIKKAKSILFGEGFDVENFIGFDSKADICVAQYVYDENYEFDIKSLFSDICKEFNKDLINDNTDIRAYYIFNPGVIEVHLKENVSINLTEDEWTKVNEADDPSMDIYDNAISKASDLVSYLSESSIDQLDEYFEKWNLDIDKFEAFIEASQYMDTDEEFIKLFAERYNDHLYRKGLNVVEESNKINDIVYTYKREYDYVPFDVQLEAAEIICSILNEDIKKAEIKKADIKKADASTSDEKEKPSNDKEDNDHNDNNDQEEGKKKSGFNPAKTINNIKLGLAGLKGKMGDMSQKEKEVSKNLDASASHFMKSIKEALVSDRREAIIKGSVIPSFSRCIKYCVALIGIGGVSAAVAGTILPAIIIAFGGFAISKKLTKRERMLMLDDIEVELDVVEKEIAAAESRGQMKKYRSLLKYKKDLQRQYQRIKYNHRIGKDLMPNSATGVYKPE